MKRIGGDVSNGQQNRFEPRLTAETQQILCGYGPRSIHLSQDRDALFVGCKDGSVTAVDLTGTLGKCEKTVLRGPTRGSEMIGARALCDLGNGWLAVGHDSGDLALLKWSEPGREMSLHTLLEAVPGCGAITHLCLWEPGQLLVSYRYQPATLYDIGPATDGSPPRLKLCCPLGPTLALGHVLKTGRNERILISKSGLLWRADSTKVTELDLWTEYTRPGFIFDVTDVKREPEAEIFEGAYLSTDGGVFLLRCGREGFEIDPVTLQGFTGMSLAIAHIVQDQKSLLWVSDRTGDVHLFWDHLRAPGEPPVWRRSGILQGAFPVTRALAAHPPKAEKPSGAKCESRVLLGQACRNDQVVLTWYSDQRDPEKRSQQLSWGHWTALKDPESKSGWLPETLIADYIEETGAKQPEELTEFLRNPSIDLASSALDEILAEGVGQRASQAVTLWTHTLVGAVHRYNKEPKTENYLGIIRWLRLLSLQYSESPSRPHNEARELLLASFEKNIQYARKWGVFGKTYADRQSIMSALVPLRSQETPDRQFDRLVYESMLLQRRVEVEKVFSDPKSDGGTPWDVRYLRVPGKSEAWRNYIAVSWIKGGVKVYTMPAAGEPDDDWTLVSPEPLPPGQEGGESKTGYSRRILLSRLGTGDTTRVFLLEAPTRTGEEKAASLWLRWIERPEIASPAPLRIADLLPNASEGHEEVESAKGEPGTLPEQESVYSLLELDPSNAESRLVLVGLQGIKGRPRIGLLRIASDGGLYPLIEEKEKGEEFSTPFPELKTVKRNPVWSLAAAEENGETSADGEGLFTVVLGCGDGQIWKIRLRAGAECFKIVNRMKVGRLGTPVWALTYREHWPDEESSSRRPRIVAGGADGTMAAFQSFVDPHGLGERYGTLWAMQEGGPIARLHLFDSKNADEGRVSQVLALTQYGTAVLVSDAAGVEALRPDEEIAKHHRFRVPGQRLGRFSLNSTVFGSALLPSEGDQNPYQPVARLVIATTDGTLRRLSLHYPKYTTQRHQKYESLQSRWLECLEDGPAGQRSIHGYLLRRPETVLVAAPGLTTGLVRWILSPNPTERPWVERNSNAEQEGMREPIEQWVPKHLRPLVELDTAWSKKDPIRGMLAKALRVAREAEDKHLFKEILEVVLNRANHQLYDEAQSPEARGSLDLFLELLEDLEDVKGVWLGSPHDLDVKMRITIAKNLLDGDTLWAIARARDRGIKGFGDVVERRIEQVHRFLGHGNLLLALETLRAANLALIRLCRRLGRPAGWEDMTDGNYQLQWESVRGFYEAVGDFAARAEHPKGSLGEVAAHEICRAYALGMLACPSALVPLSLWMAEADLPEDLRDRVQDQFLILENLLGMQMPAAPRELFEVLFEKRKNPTSYAELLLSRKLDIDICEEDLNPKLRRENEQPTRPLKLSDLSRSEDDLCRRFGQEKTQIIRGLKLSGLEMTAEDLRRKFGKENLHLILELKPFEDITAWLYDLAERLANDAGRVEGDLAKTSALHESFTITEELSHSAKFWQAALKDLLSQAALFPHLEGNGQGAKWEPEDEIRPRPVRPEIVLFSRSLEEWCRQQRQILQKKRATYEIFEPHSRIYDGALAAVERTAHRFREGAAVQKNMVLGVLGHGLLEILDEHLLELWEAAQALDPQRTWDQDDNNDQRSRDGRSSTAASFADYMLGRALNAETIPKNLRSLQGLLSYTVQEVSKDLEAGNGFNLGNLFKEFKNKNWKVPDDRWTAVLLTPRERHFLRLTLSELAQNDLYHGRIEPLDPGYDFPEVQTDEAKGPDAAHAILVFRYPTGDASRLRDAVKESDRLQRMIPARPEPRLPSHGTGLYLANLAAAAVGWKLEFADLDADGCPREKGILKFNLHREPGMTTQNVRNNL
jgi:hypothetical protein